MALPKLAVSVGTSPANQSTMVPAHPAGTAVGYAVGWSSSSNVSGSCRFFGEFFLFFLGDFADNGENDGAVVGETLGDNDGAVVGETLGERLGLAVGEEVGAVVGDFEGDVEGDVEGDMVGDTEHPVQVKLHTL